MDALLEANAALSPFCKNYMELKKGLPVRPSEMGVLNILTGRPGPHTPAVLAQMLGVSKPMITALLASLSENGYITKEPSMDDKRVYFIRPTKKALALANHTRAEMNRHFSKMIAQMGQENFDALVRLAQMANHALEANKGEIS